MDLQEDMKYGIPCLLHATLANFLLIIRDLAPFFEHNS